MEAAERLVAAIASHVVKVMGDGGGNPDLLDLRYLLDLAQEMEGSTESEIRERARARERFRDAEHAREIFDGLERRGCIRRVPQPRTSEVGRTPSPRIEIHPSLRGSDVSDKPPSEPPQSNKSNKSEGGLPPGHDSDGLTGEGRQYVRDEREELQVEESLVEVPGLLEVDR